MLVKYLLTKTFESFACRHFSKSTEIQNIFRTSTVQMGLFLISDEETVSHQEKLMQNVCPVWTMKKFKNGKEKLDHYFEQFPKTMQNSSYWRISTWRYISPLGFPQLACLDHRRGFWTVFTAYFWLLSQWRDSSHTGCIYCTQNWKFKAIVQALKNNL